MPGGPYSRIPFHGCRLPVNKCGNLTGRITASRRAALALSRPATSSHFTLGFSRTMAPSSAPRNLCRSGSSSSSAGAFCPLSPLFLDSVMRKQTTSIRTNRRTLRRWHHQLMLQIHRWVQAWRLFAQTRGTSSNPLLGLSIPQPSL